MPALTIYKGKLFGTLTTRPLAGDDLQIVCIVLGTYRLIQLICLLPLIINYFIQRFSGTDLLVNGHGIWCTNYELHNDSNDFLVLTVDEYTNYEITRDLFSNVFIILACIFMGIDVAWILMIWGATSLGSPTVPNGRDDYLRKLIWAKMFFINLFPICLLIVGCLRVAQMRKDNYGCGYDENGEPYPLVNDTTPDSGPQYNLFCALLVTYAMELFVWPAIVANKIMKWIRSNKITQKHMYKTEAKGERLEQCLGGLLKCVSMCFPSQGGQELKNQGEMKDFASNLMEFANNESKVDVVLSDMYVGGKLLARVQAERRMNGIIKLQRTTNQRASDKKKSSTNKNDGIEEVKVTRGKDEQAIIEEVKESSDHDKDATPPVANRRELLGSQSYRKRRSILTLQTDEDGKDCIVVAKDVLSSDNGVDVETLRAAAHYSIYAQYIYFHVHMTLESLIPTDATNFVRDFDLFGPIDKYSLSMWDLPNTHIHYANFYNGIAATPYAILVDDEEESVVIVIRGTNSLEDWVADLQYVPQPLDKVGELCGFDGKGHHVHKGVLTRCKWTYNDIKKQGVLKNLYSSMSPYKDYDLVVAGHSLGGGCAQVLSLMLRPSFPSLRCYAFEPPGCIFDDVLSEDCKEWITSIVHHEDVVPRVTQPNLESLRDEFFDVVARIKVPKSKAFHDVRTPCPESHLASRNAKVMCPKSQIEPDTEFYTKVQEFRKERAMKNQSGAIAVKLYIPGNIIYLVDTMGDGKKYVPYWASRYEFNQVILSGRMLADHSMPPLVDILRTLNLDDVHEEHTWHIPDQEVEEDDVEVRLVVPFSFPHGMEPLLLVGLAVAATIMALISNQGCRYVDRSSVIYPIDGEPYNGFGLKAGLWSYSLAECIDGESCDTDDISENISNLVSSDYCQPYTDNLFQPNAYWKAARVFGSLSALSGLIGIVLFSISTCTKLKRKRWYLTCVIYLGATLFQGLQFLFLKSDLCSVWTTDGGDRDETTNALTSEGDQRVDSTCYLSTDGKLAIAATVCWFLTAVGAAHMAKANK